MNPEDRALALVIVAAVAVAGGGMAYILVFAGSLPDSLPVAAGTTFTANETEHWVAHFSSGVVGGRVVGAWTAYHGSGYIGLIVVNGTVQKAWPPGFFCPRFVSAWIQQNGTVDVAVGPGDHTVYWSTGYCSSAQEIVVTQTLQLIAS